VGYEYCHLAYGSNSEGRLETAMQPALMNRLLELPVNFFRGFGAGELTNRVLAVQSMRQLLAGHALLSLLSTLFALSSFVVILVYSPLLAVVSGSLVLAAAVVSAGLAVGELRQERARAAIPLATMPAMIGATESAKPSAFARTAA
jgi:ABC-type bacteriocin/lantibiotic exporter with double-glycine peptidase domain